MHFVRYTEVKQLHAVSDGVSRVNNLVSLAVPHEGDWGVGACEVYGGNRVCETVNLILAEKTYVRASVTLEIQHGVAENLRVRDR